MSWKLLGKAFLLMAAIISFLWGMTWIFKKLSISEAIATPIFLVSFWWFINRLKRFDQKLF
jgi:hypothetical protein